MKKLNECISFPKELDVITGFGNYNDENEAYNQAIKECKDAVDKMEVDVEKIVRVIYSTKHWQALHLEVQSEILKYVNIGLAKAIADNLPKLLKERE